jgi:hypothetical protein
MDQWDYSKVPKLELKWFIVEDHWIDLIVEGTDIKYIGTDWTIQSGGGYMAGFQTADQFLVEGPIEHNHMPDDVKNQLTTHLKKFRIPGGCSLKIIVKSSVSDAILKNAYVQIDGKDVHIPFAVPEKDHDNVTLFNGSVSEGSHKISMLLAFHVSNRVNVLKHTLEHEIQNRLGFYELLFNITGNSIAGLTTDFSIKKVDQFYA